MNNQTQNSHQIKIVRLLADYIGVEPSDIDIEDNFVDDLHMQKSELFDFLQVLRDNDVDTGKIDLEEVETVDDLVETLNPGY